MNNYELYKKLTKEIGTLRASREADEKALADDMKKITSGNYAGDALKTLQADCSILRNRQNAFRENAKAAIKKIVDQYAAEHGAEKVFSAADLVEDDIKLLSLPVKLPVDQLEKMFDRNDGNLTMQNIIAAYVKERGYDDSLFQHALGSHNAFVKNIVDTMPYECMVAACYNPNDVQQVEVSIFNTLHDDSFPENFNPFKAKEKAKGEKAKDQADGSTPKNKYVLERSY